MTSLDRVCECSYGPLLSVPDEFLKKCPHNLDEVRSVYDVESLQILLIPGKKPHSKLFPLIDVDVFGVPF